MGRRGPPPNPTNIRVLRGDRRIPKGSVPIDDVCPEVAIPPCPGFLIPEAVTEWKRITPILEELGLVSALDLAMLAGYCQTYGRWVQIERELKDLGADGLADKTLMLASHRHLEHLRKFAAEFGMSPAQRVRFNIKPQETKTEQKPSDRYFPA